MPPHLKHGQINGQPTDLPTTEQQSDSYIPYFKLCFVLNSSFACIFYTSKLSSVIHMWYKRKQILPLVSFHRNHRMHTRSTPICSHLNCW